MIYMRTRTRRRRLTSWRDARSRELDATMPVYGVKTVESQLDETLLTDRLVATLSAGFGLLATFLAAIGLYGVMAFVVARRRKELGIRIALGASAGSVQWMVMREVLLLLGIGLARRRARRARARRLPQQPALRPAAARSGYRGHDGHAARDGVDPRGIHSRAAREPDRSDRGAQARVARASTPDAATMPPATHATSD